MTIMVRLEHARKISVSSRGRLCANGIRSFCKSSGLDYNEFIKNGLPIDVVESTGNAFALMACEIARKEQADQ